MLPIAAGLVSRRGDDNPCAIVAGSGRVHARESSDSINELNRRNGDLCSFRIVADLIAFGPSPR